LIGFAARDASAKHLAEQGTLNAGLLEWLNAGPDIRILAAENATLARFETAATALKQKTLAVLRIAFLSSTVLELFSALGIALVAVYVGFSLLGVFNFGTYSGTLSIASGIFILLMTPDFFQPLREMAAAWHDRAAVQALADEIHDFRLRTAQQILGLGDASPPIEGAIRIETSGVVMTPPGAASISFPDLLIAAGEKIAIVGPSGVGKSSLLSLLAGFASPDTGKINVCGKPLDGATADSWRMRLSLISQTPHMLNASVAANLTLSAPLATPQAIADALRAAAAQEVVARLPRGLHERLGENGAGVSGGEARRLMIASAALSGADLILADEPTADLDAATAAIVADALIQAANHGATLIVATHDPLLAARMDRTIALRRPA
jgi:ATP-binding cassette, subfamily C, bacterial CydD